MTPLLLLQLITSFLAGATFIALITFLVERLPTKLAGLVITIPSTMVVSLFFLGWSVGPEQVALMGKRLNVRSEKVSA